MLQSQVHSARRFLCLDDFLGGMSSQLSPTQPSKGGSAHAPALTGSAGTPPLSPALSPSEECDGTLSGSSVSLPTQVEVQPAPVGAELRRKLSEASLEDVNTTPEEQKSEKSHIAEAESETQVEVPADGASARVPPSKQLQTAKEEGPQDLRVFELNSDSGKSTPSNNGKKGTGLCFFMLHSQRLQLTGI